MEEKRWRWLITKYNTQNRDDHCRQHTNTLSHHKEMPHFKMHKVVLEVGTRYLGGKEEFVVCFRDPPPLKIGQPYHNSQMQQACLEYSE